LGGGGGETFTKNWIKKLHLATLYQKFRKGLPHSTDIQVANVPHQPLHSFYSIRCRFVNKTTIFLEIIFILYW
jgi:hypothetical protein